MSNNWTQFLSTCGASFNDAQEITFKDKGDLSTTQHHGLFLTDLSYLGLIEVSGDDNKTFLQGQLTNDINAVSSSLSHLSGLCTPKGRLRSLFLVFARGDKLYLQLPVTLLEETQKRLNMFIMMSKVALTDVSSTLVKIGVYGEQASAILQDNGFTIPAEANMVTQHRDIQLIRMAGKTDRFECIGSVEEIQSLWESIQQNAQLADTRQWRLQDIKAGIPNVYATTKEVFIPQMLNLQVLNGVNFKKGCYTGQEVVARMQYLGKLKRRMYRAHCDTDLLPIPGDKLYSASSTSGQGAGNIVDAQITAHGGIELLAVITSDAVNNNDIFIDENKQYPLIIKELPYSLEVEETAS